MAFSGWVSVGAQNIFALLEGTGLTMNNRSDVCFSLALILGLSSMLGCGSDMPFDVVPVHGKVTYDDGSLIPADSMLVNFNPISSESKTKVAPPGGQTTVNVQDGTFTAVSSHRANDGLVIGRHKVVVVAFKKGPNGSVPSEAVPAIYRNESSTPLEVEVESSNQPLEIKLSKKSPP